jgi:hypothetical protein
MRTLVAAQSLITSAEISVINVSGYTIFFLTRFSFA